MFLLLIANSFRAKSEEPTKMLEFLSEFVISTIENWGYAGIFFLMFLECSFIPIPSEVIMPFSGFVASTGQLNFWLVILVGTGGQMLGATTLFYFSLWGGRPILEKYGKYILMKKKDLDHAEKMFEKHGDAIVFIARFLPGIRMIISVPAGISKMSYAKFITYSTAGIIPFTLALTYLGVKLGENWESIKQYFYILDIVAVAIIISTVVWYLWTHIKKRNGAKNES